MNSHASVACEALDFQWNGRTGCGIVRSSARHARIASVESLVNNRASMLGGEILASAAIAPRAGGPRRRQNVGAYASIPPAASHLLMTPYIFSLNPCFTTDRGVYEAYASILGMGGPLLRRRLYASSLAANLCLSPQASPADLC
ncbi:hypothetical protein FH972_021364 [Carpinus fangiana]|uniref:Uncharacterized protein n=1 Tax=Carpinus fangiana TaxID=176857 RepID=A0A5N6KPS3_9ROSI|nr:hypothetical protein FH972_021364 [Carpinus fangiana]